MDAQRQAALNVAHTLQQNGYTALFAGGCVRDRLLGRLPVDYDVATDALPEVVEALFPKTIPLGKAFGVVVVIEEKKNVEVATFREENGSLDGRHPETVRFSSAKEDAQRRDFTINGMFFDPVSGRLHDYVHGQRDLRNRRIAAIGAPDERFKEDHLRMLRAIRFAHTLGFTIDRETETAICKGAHLINRISTERIELELTRILVESLRPGDALKHLYTTGLLQHILPEIILTAGQSQPPQFHPEGDVFEHICLMLNLMHKETKRADYTRREMAYAVLLHDIGKPETASIGPGTDGKDRIRFDGHAKVGADMAEAILTRIRIPGTEKKRIVHAVRSHMRFMDVRQMRTSTLRRLIGSETFELEINLHLLDCLGSHRKLDNYDFVLNFRKKIADEPVLPEPWIRGHDLLAMGFKEGKQLGNMLKHAYENQLEHRFHSKKEMLDWVRSIYPI